MHRVLVIGAGPAGLAHAFWRSRDPRTEVVVLEASDRPGGNVLSERRDGYLCEWGPQAVRPTAAFEELTAALGVEDLLVPSRPSVSRRWVGRRGRLIEMPSGPGGFLTSGVVSLPSRLRAIGELFVRSSEGAVDESVADFVARRFGKGMVPLAGAMVSGIFAGKVEDLEMRSAFPAMLDIERESGSVLKGMAKRAKARKARGESSKPSLVTFDRGMDGLVAALCGHVAPRCEAPAQRIGREGSRWVVELASGERVDGDELVVTVPAWIAAELLGDVDADLTAELAGIPSAPIVNVYLGQDRDAGNDRLRGFGFLLDQSEATAVLGTIYASELFDGHAPDGKSLFRVMLGGARHPGVLDADEQVVRDAAAAALVSYGRAADEFDFVHTVRIPRAIPQYVRGHGARMERIDARVARHPGLVLAGNSYRGVALGDQLGRPTPLDVAEVA